MYLSDLEFADGEKAALTDRKRFDFCHFHEPAECWKYLRAGDEKRQS